MQAIGIELQEKESLELRDAIRILRERQANLLNTNLIYLRFPVVYRAVDPTRQVAEAVRVRPISVTEILVQRFSDRWDRLLQAEQQGKLVVIGEALSQDLVSRVKDGHDVVICDTEVLHPFSEVKLTALLYPHSGPRLVVVGLKAERVPNGLRLLGTGPVYSVENCTVLEVEG